MKKITLFVALFVFALFLSVPAAAQGEGLEISVSPSLPALTDGKEKNSVTVETFTLSSEEEIKGIYLVFYETAPNLTVSSGGVEKEVNGAYLRRYVSVSDLFGGGKRELVLSFSQPAKLMEVYAFGESVPNWVQRWEAPCEKADLCLFTSHADDEQLFFAGVLPTYAGEKKLEVQVVYFTDHKNEPLRRHELLRGLWTVGVTHYPVISPFPDLYSKDGATAEKQLASRGWKYEDVVGFQVEMLRKFKPLVVVGHDPKGEYGHGQHILNSKSLQEAVLLAGTQGYPESLAEYGAWEVPKTYLHSYAENQITLNWDIPLSAFDGKTAFQVTQEGFLCHDSQQYTWFRGWLLGKNGEIARADQIKTHSPCAYGLFRSLVGEDIEKNDFFEHQETYEEKRLREEEEARQKEAEEKARLEEEARKQKEAEEKAQAEKVAAEKAAARNRRRKVLIVSASVTGTVLILAAVFVLVADKRKGDAEK